ncbi:MAG: hypothetical protein H7249_04000 [Chitinophagaceae bacterium]|nr:hypothetical protein [Oligoflexus sp.]
MAALLSLTRSTLPHQNDEILEFIAIFCPDEKFQDALQNLSPKTMQWQPDLWVIDMRACRAFWLHTAGRKDTKVNTMIADQLTALFAETDYYGAAAATPWEAILLVKAAREKGFHGMIHFSSRLGRNLLRGISWDLWWESCREYAENNSKIRSRNHTDSILSKGRTAMTLAMQRLGCARPDLLRTLPSSHIRRRFGSLIAEVWQLSFPHRQGLSKSEAIALFPWAPYLSTEKPFVKRHLDNELKHWDAIEELLREDINRLCVLGSFKKEERILNLEWRIVLCNLHAIPIYIPFRHPHSLHQDCPSQRTALLQIQYAFEKEKLFATKASSQETGLISWELEILEKAPARFRQGSLFHESSDDLAHLKQLENMIRKPLEGFGLAANWLAEDSFYKQVDAFETCPSQEDYLPLAQERPLFLYTDAHHLPFDQHTRVGPFQERTMDKWWKSKNRSRDYYRMTQGDTMLWVYRDQRGSWISQGVYG